jgi:hypothetical protein
LWDKGDAVYSVTDVLDLEGFADGEWRQYFVDHKDVLCSSEDVRLARFSLAELPMFSSAPGYIILPVLSGTTGQVFRVWVGYYEDEYVYGVGAEPGAGDATVTWTRKGVLASDA